MSIEKSGLAWRKSTYSGPEGGDCVEVALSSGAVRVRDSKDVPTPSLKFSRDDWRAVVTELRRSRSL